MYNVAIFISLDIFGIVGQRIIEGVVMVFCENIAGAGAVMECKCFVIKLDTPFAHTVMTIYTGSRMSAEQNGAFQWRTRLYLPDAGVR